MRECHHAALAAAITARFEGRIDLRGGQRLIAEEFGLTQADVSIMAGGHYGRMTVDKLLGIAHKLGIFPQVPVVYTVTEESDQAFSAALARIKSAAIGAEEAKANARGRRRGGEE